MVLIAQIALGVIIGLAQAAEPKGTLTLACQGTKSETTPRIADADQSSVSVDIIIDFGPRPLRCTRGTTPCGPNQREIMSVHMEQYESAPLFKADNATFSFYATKDGKISVTIRGWDQSKTVLAGQTVCAELGASTPCGPNHRCPSAQVANPQHDSIFHPRTWHRAAPLGGG